MSDETNMWLEGAASDAVRDEYGPVEPVEPAETVIGGEAEVLALRRARITWADQIEPEPVVWAWKDGDQGRIPAGSLSTAAGREGTGKSSFAIWLTAQITKGTLPGSYFGTPRRVFYVAVEDSWKHTLVPRLMAAGADLTKVGRFDVVNIYDDEIMLSLPHDNAMLEATIVEHSAALVVIDPLLSAIGEKINTHQSREVRSALDPLARIADRTNSVLLGIAHFNKGTGTDASSLITGSGAFKDVPRTVFGFVRDDSEEDETRIMTQTKNTLAPEGPSLSYRIEQAVIDTKLGAAITSRFVFTGTSERSVQDVLRDARSGDPDDPGERDDAAEWLSGYLQKHGGEAKAADIFKAAKADQVNERTLQRARKRAGITSVRSGFGEGSTWALPDPLTTHSRRLRQEPGAVTNGTNVSSMQESDVRPDEAQQVDSAGSNDPPAPSRHLPEGGSSREPLMKTPPSEHTGASGATGPGYPNCQLCGVDLWAPQSQLAGICGACGTSPTIHKKKEQQA